jgi:hypothetical protein
MKVDWDPTYCLYGGKVKYFDACNELDELESQACFLSNNYVMMPYHCLQEDAELVYRQPAADMAIAKVPEKDEVTSLFVVSVPAGSECTLSMNDGNVLLWREKIGTYLWVFGCSNGLQPGDSGKIIIGCGNLTNGFTDETLEGCESPLFMVIARQRGESRTALTVYLPYLLEMIRFHKSIEPISPNMWNDWEPISSFGEVKAQVAMEANKLSRNNKAKRISSMKKCGRQVDSEFIKKLFDTEEEEDLKNAFLVKVDVGSVTNDPCWVVQYERENLRATSGYFKLVDTFMVKKGMFNVDVRTHKVFSASSRPLTVDAAAFGYFRTRLKNEHTACHHPFLCELNEGCKGVQRKENKKGEELNSRWISHTCIRPSHLAHMNKHFNDYCTVLQNLFENNNTSSNW